MHTSFSRGAKALFFAALGAALLAGCKTPADTNPASLTADTKAFVVHAVNRFPSQNANDYNNQIIVIDVTYTNTDPIPQNMRPNKFVLIDQNTQAQYRALDGGDIHVPAFAGGGLLDPAKTIELSLGFRVPASMTSAHLSYSP